MFNRFIACCLALATFTSCSNDGTRQLRNYYFPTEYLRSGMVYEYLSEQGDSVVTEYWYYRSFIRDSGQFLAGTYYDERFQIGQIVREKIVDTGAAARDYFLYDTDPATGKQNQIRTTIESPQIFPFQVKDSVQATQFSLSYRPPDDTLTRIRIVRQRRFLGNAPTFNFRGEKIPCVRFSLRETIGDDSGDTPLEGLGEEHYALGLGRVYYRKSYGTSGAIKFEYRLHDVFPMSELERRAGVNDEVSK